MKRLSNPYFSLLVWFGFAVLSACVVINEDEYFEFPVERRFINEMPEAVELAFVVYEDSARVMIPPGDSAVFEGKGIYDAEKFFFEVGWKSYNLSRGEDDRLSFTFADGRKVTYRDDLLCSDSVDNPIWGEGNGQTIFCGYEVEIYKDPDLKVERYRIDSTDYALAE